MHTTEIPILTLHMGNSVLHISSFMNKVYIAIHVVIKNVYCILRGRIKGFNCSITTILFEVGSYRTVVG